MAHPAPELHYEYARFLAAERENTCKLEYWNGLILAMAGGTPGHSARTMRLAASLSAQLEGRCTVYGSDAKIRIRNANHDASVYPDISVVCGPAEVAEDDENAITNPLCIVEVLSPGTEQHDRSDKLAAYQSLPSVQEVMFVSHDTECVEVARRLAGESRWVIVSARRGQSIQLASIACTVEISNIYLGGAAPGL
jgi:Uma2 family endonuclease